MNGHQQLIALRISGIKPRCVFVLDSDEAYDLEDVRTWHENRAIDGTYHARVHIAAEDVIEALDFRWARGLLIHIVSHRSPARFHRIFDACVNQGASSVAGVVNGKTLWAKNEN